MQASAQTAQAPQIKLLLGIVVEGLDDGSLEMLRESFGEGGFRYLYRNGVYLPQADFGTQLDATSATVTGSCLSMSMPTRKPWATSPQRPIRLRR